MLRDREERNHSSAAFATIRSMCASVGLRALSRAVDTAAASQRTPTVEEHASDKAQRSPSTRIVPAVSIRT